ncbi:hypothetical protein E3O06_07455 [Cryobacterium glaciale]|uniref:Uncharacterized protein n=1 Tax=Cryobacterium glaciale TaxID=1259145 RepID=A0A4R8UXC3_9MICO|nr:hypothetical protein [Cryobacterium glaciale]TFB73661.1 hypothetical protein E3O06_07455 [Cryobacterium glaciale]
MTTTANQRRHGVVSGTRPSRRSESGYTLVELLIYSSLLVLVLTVAGGMLLNTLTSEQKVLDSANANTVSQLISSSVHSGVRNATALKITDSADTDDQLLVVTAVSSDPAATAAARVCQAWYYTEQNGGAMYYQRGTAPIVAPTADALAHEMTGWTLLGSGLSATEVSAGVTQPLFHASSAGNPSITLNFAINADGDSSPALISTTVTSRQSAASNGAPCF